MSLLLFPCALPYNQFGLKLDGLLGQIRVIQFKKRAFAGLKAGIVARLADGGLRHFQQIGK